MSDCENNVEFDEKDDVDLNSHIRLIKAIGTLDKTQHILKPTRDGYSDTKSEFHLSKKIGSKSTAAVSDIIKILGNSAEHSATSKKLKTAQKNNKTLQKPLERHEAASIKRSTGFEDVKAKLGKWDAVVSRNRTIEYQKFPIESASFKKTETKDYLSKFTLKSELENELEKLNPVEEEPVVETFPMTMNELLEHRKEAARLRAKQSYKEAKSRRQSKIKSKKFHRIQRKERVKQQLKDFESLQKSDPEQALQRLEQLERARAQERVSLRHKSTGHWAKNKLIRAKYDKETRQQLAEQLAISRDLTQKNVVKDSESEEEVDNTPILPEDSQNPWLSKVMPSKEVTDFVSGYKKYWETRNNLQKSNDINVNVSDDIIESKFVDSKENQNDESCILDIQQKNSEPVLKRSKKHEQILEIICLQSTTHWNVESVPKKFLLSKEKTETDSENLCVENMFDDLEYRLETKIKNKLNLLKTDNIISKAKVKVKKNKSVNVLHNGEFKKKKLRPQIDEELNETTNSNDLSDGDVLKNENSNNVININNSLKMENANTIDPNKFVAIKPVHLQSTLPDIDIDGDHLDDEENERKMTIAEAFEDDDIVAEFRQEKDMEINKNKPQIEDVSLPGWGSWVGKGIKPSKRRNRFLSKAPIVLPRKDDKKDNVIINESKDSKLKLHQVSELPFPFTSVSDFEASIRAPIGNTFIPETAHKKLIKPAITVKTGIIIEPMDESQLVVMKRGKPALIEKTKKWF